MRRVSKIDERGTNLCELGLHKHFARPLSGMNTLTSCRSAAKAGRRPYACSKIAEQILNDEATLAEILSDLPVNEAHGVECDRSGATTQRERILVNVSRRQFFALVCTDSLTRLIEVQPPMGYLRQ